MSFKKKKQLFLLNSIIVLVNSIIFSNAFLGISLLQGNAVELITAWATIAVSIGAFVKGNMYILKSGEMHLMAKDIKSLNDCISVFEEAIYNGDVFDKNLKKNIEQIKRYNRKKNTIDDMLLQKFSANEMTFQKFSEVLKDVEKIIYMNMRSIINKISAFDIEEYEKMQKNNMLQKISNEKMEIYNQYINFVNDATEINEEILLKLDKIIAEELSRCEAFLYDSSATQLYNKIWSEIR